MRYNTGFTPDVQDTTANAVQAEGAASARFKKGDVVQIAGGDDCGSISTVTNIYRERVAGRWIVNIVPTLNGVTTVYAADLTLIEPAAEPAEPAFNLGDAVQVTGENLPYAGNIGTVIDTGVFDSVQWYLIDIGKARLWYRIADLTLVEPAPEGVRKPSTLPPFLDMMQSEIGYARANFPPMHSYHEGYAVILEEIEELWLEIKKKPAARSKEALQEELVQIATMCWRFAEDLDVVPAEPDITD